MPQSIYDNGGIIGVTLDFRDTNRYGGIPYTTANFESSIDYPAGAATGDVVVFFHSDDNTLGILPTGFTQLEAYNGNGTYTRIAYRVLDGSEGSSFTISSDGVAIAVLIEGQNSPIEIVSNLVSNTDGNPNPPSVTFGYDDNAVVLAFAAIDDQLIAGGIAAPSGYELIATVQGGVQETSGQTIGLAYTQISGTEADPGGFSPLLDEERWTAATIAIRHTAGLTIGNLKNSGIWSLQSVLDSILDFDPEAGLTLSTTHAASGNIADNYGPVSTVFAATLIFPTSPTDGLIWETGGTGQGAWLGIRDSGTTMRLRGGDGGEAKTASDINTAVLEITDFPKDGQPHTLVWDFNDSSGTVRIFIDGELKGTASATGGSFENGQFSGTANGAYISNSSDTVTAGESTTASNFTEAGTGLRVYLGQVVNYV